MELFRQDLRRAVRGLLRAPGFAAVAVSTLALGIGANTAVFSEMRALLLRPLPFPASERLVQIWQAEPDNLMRPVAPANFLDWRRDSRSFVGLAAFSVRRRNLLGDEPELVDVASVSSNFLSVLGLAPGVGRGFGREDRPEAVLSHGLWQRAYGGDTAVVGRTLRLDESAYEIVGVLPPAAVFPESVALYTRAPREIPQVGVPIEADVTTLRDARFLGVLGRLRGGVALEDARAEMAAIAARLEREYPEENARNGVHLLPLHESLMGPARPTLRLMTSAAACLFLIAAANVAALLLARSLRREREVAVRLALGAGWRRLASQFLAEGLVLALAGAAGGVGLALAAGPLLRLALPADTPAFAAARLDLPVLLFTLLASIGCALLVSLVPAAQASVDPARALGGARASTGGREAVRLHGALVVAELSLAVVLVAGAALLLKSLWRLETAAAGVDTTSVLTLRVSLPAARTLPEARRKQFYADAIERIAALPGVRHAGATQTLPFAGRGISAGLRVEGRSFTAAEVVDTCWRTVTPGYFDAVGLPLLRGRAFGPEDGAEAPPVAIVNARLAALLWPGADPLGRRIGTGMDGSDDALATIVGVVADAPQEGVAAGVRPEMYRPLAQPTRFAAESMSLAVRAEGDGAAVLPLLREAVRSVNPQAPLTDLKRLADLRRATTARQTGAGAALTLFGLLALLLAAVGLYGLLAFGVGQRRREFGIRLALGARPVEIVAQVLSDSLRLVALGLGLGLVAALGLTRSLASLLYGVHPADAPTLGAVAATLALVALAASVLPARRAARVDPALALRQD